MFNWVRMCTTVPQASKKNWRRGAVEAVGDFGSALEKHRTTSTRDVVQKNTRPRDSGRDPRISPGKIRWGKTPLRGFRGEKFFRGRIGTGRHPSQRIYRGRNARRTDPGGDCQKKTTCKSMRKGGARRGEGKQSSLKKGIIKRERFFSKKQKATIGKMRNNGNRRASKKKMLLAGTLRGEFKKAIRSQGA